MAADIRCYVNLSGRWAERDEASGIGTCALIFLSAGFESQLKSVGFPGAAIPAIAKGHATADAALDQWLRSEGNRKNLLDPRYRLLGVGVAASHWTVILGVAA